MLVCDAHTTSIRVYPLPCRLPAITTLVWVGSMA